MHPHKRQRQEQAQEAEAKAEEEKEKAQRREKYAKVDHYGALCKIMRHLLTAPAKFSKCLSMAHELVRESFDFLTTFVEGEECVTSGNVLFNMFDAVMRVEGKFKVREDRETIEKLYLFLVELSENEEDLFSELQEKVLDLLYIPVYVQSSLVTDDSFKVQSLAITA